MAPVFVVCMFILPKELLGGEVASECDGGDAEAREGALEAIEAGEGTCVAPLLATGVSRRQGQAMV